MEIFFKAILFGLMAYLVFYLWKSSGRMFKHQRKGTSQEWQNVALLAAGVIGFIVLLIYIAKN